MDNDTDKLRLLLEAFVELNKMVTTPGEKSHALWNSTDRVWNLIKEIARRPDAAIKASPKARR